MEERKEAIPFSGVKRNLMYYGFEGKTYFDFHGLVDIVGLAESTTFKRTKKILQMEGKNPCIRYYGKTLYEADFCFKWWVIYSKYKSEGRIK